MRVASTHIHLSAGGDMTDEFEKRTSINFTKRAHQRMRAMCKELEISQQDLINAILENIGVDAVRPLAAKTQQAKTLQREKERLIRQRLAKLSPEQLERLLLQAEE